MLTRLGRQWTALYADTPGQTITTHTSCCPNAVSYLDIGGVTVLDHVETPIGEVHLQDGAIHQKLVDPRVKLRGGVKVLVEDNIRTGTSLTFMYEPPQPTPSGDLNTDRDTEP